MQRLEAIGIDVRHSVFENETDSMMYVVRDVYAAETVYMISLTAYSFSLLIREEYVEKDLLESLRYESLFQPERKEKLKAEIRRVIENW